MPFCAKTVKWTHLTTRSGLVTAKWFCLKSLTLYSVPSVKTYVLLSFVLRFRNFCLSAVVIESVHHWHKFINPICYFYLPHHFYRFGSNALWSYEHTERQRQRQIQVNGDAWKSIPPPFPSVNPSVKLQRCHCRCRSVCSYPKSFVDASLHCALINFIWYLFHTESVKQSLNSFFFGWPQYWQICWACKLPKLHILWHIQCKVGQTLNCISATRWT